MSGPLHGRCVALSETRQLDALAQMLEQQGAVVLRCPMVAILDSPDRPGVDAFLADLAAGKFDDVILFTGEGLRRLLGFARRAGLYEPALAALAKVRKITRGPKPAKALSEIGLRPDLAASAPTTDGLIASLTGLDLAGRRVAVQLYGEERNDRFIEFLKGKGAAVGTVAPYVYAPAADDARIADLIERMAAGAVDVVAFTSSPQVQRLFDVAPRLGLSERLAEGLGRTRVAAVGPIAADELARHGVRVDITPPKNFFMKPLVTAIIEALAPRTAP